MASTNEQILALWRDRNRIKEKQQKLTTDLKAIDEQLLKLIPKNDERAGIKHVYIESRSTSWSKALKEARARLSKVARGHLADAIEHNTKIKTASRLQLAAQED